MVSERHNYVSILEATLHSAVDTKVDEAVKEMMGLRIIVLQYSYYRWHTNLLLLVIFQHLPAAS